MEDPFVYSRPERNPKYFHPARTQPFLITFFQAVVAFKKVCKMMRLRLGKNRQSNYHKRPGAFRRELVRSAQLIKNAKKGEPVINLHQAWNQINRTTIATADEFYRKQSLRMTNAEKLFRSVNQHLEQSAMKERMASHETLEAKLSKLTFPNKKEGVSKRITTIKAQDNTITTSNNPFNNFVDANRQTSTTAGMTEEVEGKRAIPIDYQGDYIEGTAIYYGSAIAIQARHGGFLSYNNGEVKASAHKVLFNSKFIVKKSDDLSDIGLIKYGDALWLQAGAGFVLGAQYGSLVDQKRQIQPTLVSCKRQNMFKAHQYGRWIVLNRDRPMATLGKPVCHFDKILLEQEWYFLSSQSPYESNMYKSVNNSDEAMTTKYNLFDPPEECSWKVHLVALPTEDRDDLRQRQQLLQEAKDQIHQSQETRYSKSQLLLSCLSESLSAELQDSYIFNTVLQHKLSHALDQQHLLSKYHELENIGFDRIGSSPSLLRKIYGKESKIPLYYDELFQRTNTNHSDVITATDLEGTDAVVSSLESEYWNNAQKLLVRTESWMELPNVMVEYQAKDHDKKVHAAQVLQGFIRKSAEKVFSFPRAMRKIDTNARLKMEERDFIRNQILRENMEISPPNNAPVLQNTMKVRTIPRNEQRARSAGTKRGGYLADSRPFMHNTLTQREKSPSICSVSVDMSTLQIRKLALESTSRASISSGINASYFRMTEATNNPSIPPAITSQEGGKMDSRDHHRESAKRSNDLKTGIKFLKAVSLKNANFDDIKVVKRRKRRKEKD